jgi:hypothetical protein
MNESAADVYAERMKMMFELRRAGKRMRERQQLEQDY